MPRRRAYGYSYNPKSELYRPECSNQKEVQMSKKGSRPDKVSRFSASFLGTGIGEAHETKIRKGGATYTGKSVSKSGADKAAGDKYRRGDKDR